MAKELAPWEMEWAAPSDPLTEAVNRSAATVEVAPKAPKSFPLGEKDFNVKRKRTQKWDQYIDIFASEYPDLPDLGNLAKAAMLQESGGHVKATSTVNGKPGARGLMQVMPKTWEGMGRDPSKIYDPIENIAGGVQYLAEQYRAFGDRRLAMAAYNAGPGNVRKAGNRVPDIEETKAYVDAVEGYYGVLAGTDTPPWELPWATPGQEKPGVGMGDVKLAESQATPLPATVRKFVAHPFGGGTYTVPAPTEKELALEAQKEADIARGEDVRQRQRDAPEGAFLTPERIGREKFRPPPGEMVETLMPPSGPGGEMYTLKAPRGDNPMEAIGAAMSGMTQDNTGFLADVIRGKGHTQRLGERVRLAEEEAGRQAKYATPEGKALLASAQKKAEKMQKMSVDEEEALAENPDFAQQMEDFAGAVKDDFPQFAKDLAAQIIEDGPFLVLASRGAHSVLRAMSKAGSAYRAGAIARRAESLAKNPAALEARLAARGPTAAPTALETIARAKRVGAAVEAERVSTQALGKTPIIARVGEESAEDIAALAAVQYPKEAAAGRKYGGIELTRDVILGTFGGVAIGAFRRSIDTRVSRKTAAGARKVAYLTGAENHPAIQEMLPQFAALAENPEVAGVRFKIDAGEQKPEFWDRARLDAADYKDRPEGWYIKAGEAGKGKAIILRKSAGQETVVEETAHFIQDQLRKRVKEDVEGDGPYSRLAEQIKDWEGKIREAAKEKGVSVPEGDELFAQTFAAHMGYADKFPQSVRRIVIPDGILLGFRRLMSEDPAIRGESFQAGDLRQAEAVPRTGEKGDALARAEDAYFADRKQGDEAEIARAEFEYDQSIRAYLGMEASTADIPARRRPLPNDEPVPAAPEQSATPAATPVKPSKPVAPAKPGKPAKQAEPVKPPVKPVETAEAPRERPNRAAGVSFRKFREVQGYLSKKDSKTGKKIPPSDSEVLQYLRELGDEPVPEKTRRVHSSKMGNAPREARSREIGMLNHVLRDGDEGLQTEVMKGADLPPQFETAFVKLTKVETHDKRMIRYKDGKGATYDFKADEDIHVGGNHEYGIKPWDEANPPFQLKESPKPSELQKRTTERFRGYVESIKAKPWEMNWPVAPTSEDIARSIELTDRRGQTRFQLKGSQEYPKAKKDVDGLKVREIVPNTASIDASVGEYKTLSGIREVSFSSFPDRGEPVRGKREIDLADQIKASGEINPLIVVIDSQGPYILEGSHRFDALQILGKKSFPAIIVKDLSEIATDDSRSNGPWGRTRFQLKPGEKVKGEQEDMFGGRGRVASQGLIKAKNGDKGLDDTPLFNAADAEATEKAGKDQQSLFQLKEANKGGIPLDDADPKKPTTISVSQAFIKRNFTSKGDLPAEVFQAKIEKDGWFNSQTKQVSYTLRDFKQAVKKAYPGGAKPHQVKVMDSYLKGEANAFDKLPAGVKTELDKMRAEVDALSGWMVRSGAVEGDLALRIQDNMGVYLNRSYRVFDDPNWADKVPKDVRNKAKALLRQEYPGKSEAQISGLIENLLYEGKAGETPIGVLRRGKLGSKDLSMLTKRKGIAPEIRALWGEYEDPVVNYTRSVTKMAHIVSNHQFLETVKKSGMDNYFHTEPIVKDGISYDVRLAADESDVMRPLNGLYTSREIKTAFEQSMGKEEAPDWLRMYAKVNGVVKYSKTIGSIMTHVRNLTGNTGFAVANGHWNVGKAKGAFQTVLSDIGLMNDKKWQTYYRELQEMGVVHESANAGELMDVIKDAGSKGPMSFTDNAAVKFGKDVIGTITTAYRAEDDVWKIYAYENELARYKKAQPNVDEKALKKRVATIIRDTYPTYSLVPAGVKFFRRFPLVGTFTSFPAEVIRTAGNTIALAAKEMKDPALRSIGAQRVVGMIAAATAIGTAAMVSRSLIGISKEDDKNIRAFLPPWSRNSQILYLGYNDDNELLWVDLSYVDPHSYLKTPLMAFIRGDEWEDKVIDAGVEALSPFLSEQILAAKMFDIARNTTDRGKQVYNPEGSWASKAVSVISHVADAMEPGTVGSMRRIVKGLAGQTSIYGKEYNPSIEALATFSGQRVSALNVPQALAFKTRDLNRRLMDAKRILSGVVSRRGTVSEKEIKTAYENMETSREELWTETQAVIQAANKMGVEYNAVQKELQAGGFSHDDARQIMRGEYAAFKPGKQFLKERIGEAKTRNDADAVSDFVNRKNLVKALAKEASDRVREKQSKEVRP